VVGQTVPDDIGHLKLERTGPPAHVVDDRG
jgi:hypothetical protein